VILLDNEKNLSNEGMKLLVDPSTFLEEANVKNNLLRARVFEWHNRFSEEGENVADERSDRLITKKTDDNVRNVMIVVRTDHQNEDTGISCGE
jgi:hypothetical protein